jgi:hypothetical protein
MKRLGVSVREAAWLLSNTETRVRRLAKRGTLDYAVAWSRITPASIRAAFPTDEFRPLREAALDAILTGRVSVPAAPSPDARPAPINNFAPTSPPPTPASSLAGLFVLAATMTDNPLIERSNTLTWLGYTLLVRSPISQSLQPTLIGAPQ